MGCLWILEKKNLVSFSVFGVKIDTFVFFTIFGLIPDSPTEVDLLYIIDTVKDVLDYQDKS